MWSRLLDGVLGPEREPPVDCGLPEGVRLRSGRWIPALGGIMGRMAAYTGQVITWEDALNSKESLAPEGPLDMKMKLETPPVAIPGRTKFA